MISRLEGGHSCTRDRGLGGKIYKEVSSLGGIRRSRCKVELAHLLHKLRDLYCSHGGCDIAALARIFSLCRSLGLMTAYLHIIMCNIDYVFVIFAFVSDE